MKYYLFTLVLALFLVSCDTTQQPAVSEETVTFSNEVDTQNDDVLAAKPTCPCWASYGVLEAFANGESVNKSTMSKFDKGRTQASLKIGGTTKAEVGTGQTGGDSDFRWGCFLGSDTPVAFQRGGEAHVCVRDVARYITETPLCCTGTACPRGTNPC